MKKVWILVWEPTTKGGKQRPMYYTRLVHKGLAGQEYVSLYGSKWRIRPREGMNDIFVLDGMLE